MQGFLPIARIVALVASAIVLIFSMPLLAAETLHVLAWDGYADPDIVTQFERRNHVKVVVTYVNSDDQLWDKVSRNQGADYDVFAVNTAELQRYIDADLSVALQIEDIPNHLKQLPRFQNLVGIPGLVRDNRIYAIPYAYSEMGLIYNRKEVKDVPQSMAAMWDPQYKGRVLAFNTSNHNFSIVGLLMGVKNPFRLNNEELRLAAKRLVGLRRNVLTFYNTPEEAVKLFTHNRIALVFGNYGTQQVKALKEAGADIGYIIPNEGALAWLDCWAMTRGAKNRKLASMWIDYMIERESSERLTSAHGLANTVTDTSSSRPEDKIIWLEPLANPNKRKELWDRIMSGEAPERF